MGLDMAQIERPTWKKKHSSKWSVLAKKWMAHHERQRARRDIECPPQYRRYRGWQY
jgi:hypothetical protein